MQVLFPEYAATKQFWCDFSLDGSVTVTQDEPIPDFSVFEACAGLDLNYDVVVRTGGRAARVMTEASVTALLAEQKEQRQFYRPLTEDEKANATDTDSDDEVDLRPRAPADATGADPLASAGATASDSDDDGEPRPPAAGRHGLARATVAQLFARLTPAGDGAVNVDDYLLPSSPSSGGGLADGAVGGADLEDDDDAPAGQPWALDSEDDDDGATPAAARTTLSGLVGQLQPSRADVPQPQPVGGSAVRLSPMFAQRKAPAPARLVAGSRRVSVRFQPTLI